MNTFELLCWLLPNQVIRKTVFVSDVGQFNNLKQVDMFHLNLQLLIYLTHVNSVYITVFLCYLSKVFVLDNNLTRTSLCDMSLYSYS